MDAGGRDASTDFVTCEPYVTDDPDTCAAGQAHFVGTAGCQPVGDPCPVGDVWPTTIPSGATVIYVNANVIVPGLGNTRIGAYRRIESALARATSGTVVAVATGTYDEVLTIPDGVTVLGACAAQTVIQPTTQGDRTDVFDGVVRAAVASTGTLKNVSVAPSFTLVGLAASGGRNLVLRGVAVSNAYRAGIYAQGGGRVDADGLTVDSTRAGTDGFDGAALVADMSTVAITRGMLLRSKVSGAFISGGTVTLQDVAVRGTQPQVSNSAGGEGLRLESGAQATVSRSLFDSNRSSGIAAIDPGVRVVLTDSVVRRTTTNELPIDGFGLFVGPGARAEASRSTFDRNQSVAIIAAGANAQLSLTDVAVTATASLASGQYGRGLDVELGGTAELLRVLVDGNRDNGVFVSDANTSLVATDLTITRTERGMASIDGVGALQVRNGASATVTRATLAFNREGGLQAVDSDTLVSITDLVVRDADCGPSVLGNGVDVGDGARLTLARASIVRSQHVGLFASGAGTQVTATDLHVLGTRPADTGERGWGLRAQDGANVRVERGVVNDSRELSVFARDMGTGVVLVDTAIARTSASTSGSGGYGIVAFNGAQLTLERGTVAQSHDIAVLASDPRTSVGLTDVRVSQTQPTSSGTRGWGAAAQLNASLSMTRVELEESTDLGVLAFGAPLTLQDVLVSGVVKRPCLASGSCPSSATWESGMGLASVNGSQVTASSFQVESAARCGVLNAPGTSGLTPSFTSAAVYRSEIGFCQQASNGPAVPSGLYLDPGTNSVPSQRSSYATPSAVSFL